jgi:hypothetical protein
MLLLVKTTEDVHIKQTAVLTSAPGLYEWSTSYFGMCGMSGYGLESFGTRYGPVAGSCEPGK